MLSARRESATVRETDRDSSPATQTDGGVPWAGFDTVPSDLNWGASYVGLAGSRTEEGDLSWMRYRWGDRVRWVSWKNLGWINVES